MVVAVKPRTKRPAVPDEVLIARVEALVCVLRDVLVHCVDERQHMFMTSQRALREAWALVAELEGEGK